MQLKINTLQKIGKGYIYSMKNLCLLLLLLPGLAWAQNTSETAKRDTFAAVESIAEFPGGTPALYQYISDNLKIPEVAQLIGTTGKVNVTFVIEKDGRLTDIKPLTFIGAGCEAAAVDVFTKSPRWSPGMQNGKPLRMQYTIPISFNLSRTKVKMSELKKSNYSFIFLIDEKIYKLDEAELILGSTFSSGKVLIAEHYTNDNKHNVQGKKETYLIKIKV